MRQILSLSGGGYRGLFSARVLAELENRSGSPLYRRFDVIAGTSIGGIIAIGLAVGVTPSDICSAMEERGPDIFDKRGYIPFTNRRVPRPRLGLLKSRYSANGLRAAIEAVLGDSVKKKLSQVDAPLLVVAVNRSSERTVVFTSNSLAPCAYGSVTLMDVALATSAAPTYFPEHSINNENMIDGGITANAPDLLALLELMQTTGATASEIRMLSIGTAAGHNEDKYRPAGSYGALRWLSPAEVGGRNLFGTTITAQERLAVSAASRLLGDRHLRVDRQPSPQQQKELALDKTGIIASKTLAMLASSALSDLNDAQKRILGEILRHRAAWAEDA